VIREEISSDIPAIRRLFLPSKSSLSHRILPPILTGRQMVFSLW